MSPGLSPRWPRVATDDLALLPLLCSVGGMTGLLSMACFTLTVIDLGDTAPPWTTAEPDAPPSLHLMQAGKHSGTHRAVGCRGFLRVPSVLAWLTPPSVVTVLTLFPGTKSGLGELPSQEPCDPTAL